MLKMTIKLIELKLRLWFQNSMQNQHIMLFVMKMESFINKQNWSCLNIIKFNTL